MKREEILKSLDSIIATSIGHHDFELYGNLKPDEIIGWDSMANALILTSIEQQFGVKFKFSDMLAWKTIGQLVELIQYKIG